MLCAIDSRWLRAGRFYCSRRNSTSAGWVSKQYDLETCLLEVAIRCQSARNPALFHHQERQAVREAPVLVASVLIKTHRSGNAVSGEGHNFDLRILVTSPVAFRRRTPCPGICQRIHPFPQNSLSRQNEGIPLDQVLAPGRRPPMVLIGLVGKSNPEMQCPRNRPHLRSSIPLGYAV